MKGPLRRSHTKSRNGCLNCKRKHVKCNEVQPKCANCERLNVACVYPTATSSSSSPDTLVTAAISHIAVKEGPWDRELAISDLELLHNYTSDMIPSIGSFKNDTVALFNKHFVDVGFQKIYPLHSILATSALHLFYKDRTRIDLFSRASSLQSTALRLAQPHIVHLSEEHSIGIFVFSSFTAIFAFAEVMLNPHDPSYLRDPMEEVINCFQLTRGIATVITPFWRSLNATWLKPAFDYEDNRDDLRPTLESDIPTYNLLMGLVQKQETQERKDASAHAIELLLLYISIFRSNSRDHPSSRLMTSWPCEIKKEVMDMLSERDPLALVILAYYAVLLQERDDIWYVKGWPKMIMEYVDSTLGDEWNGVLEWPRDAITSASAQLTPAAATA